LGRNVKARRFIWTCNFAEAHERILINKVRRLGKTLIPSLPTSSAALSSSPTSHLGFSLQTHFLNGGRWWCAPGHRCADGEVRSRPPSWQ
jgi:hypothetical protein